MTDLQVRCFLEVVRFLNFTRAARELYISQSNISRQIASLEEELGLALFDRNSKGVKLTDQGQMLAEDEPPALGKAYWGSGHARLLKRYYEEQKYFSPADAANTMAAVFAMYESAKKGGKEIKIK